MELAGQDVLVLGLGLSGSSAARFCAERGARVVAADERSRDRIRDIDALPASVETRLGKPFPDLESFDLVVPSPGIAAERWTGKAKRVWGDIELCYRALRVPIIAVTGTNGKSTVVRLIESMARAAGLRAQAAGNLGIPALDLVGQPLDVAVLEVSSFQLESIDAFRPRTSLLLNLSPDHLDRHGDLDGYLQAKQRLFANQGAGDFAILNADDAKVWGTSLRSGVERLGFSSERPLEAGAWLDGRNALVRRGGRTERYSLDGPIARASAQRTQPHGDNVLAALLALSTLDADLGRATEALANFQALPHRCQHVAEVRGVDYVDDSKATNPGAAARALRGFSSPLVWIAGGRHKGGELETLARNARGRVRRALLIGEAAAEFERALSPDITCERPGSLAEAVVRAGQIAESGDTVLLAPACASFDQFKNFEDRGLQFQAAVAALGASHGSSHGSSHSSESKNQTAPGENLK